MRSCSKKPVLGRLAEASIRHHWVVLASWAGALIVIGILAGILGRSYSEDYDLGGSESQKAASLLAEHFRGSSEQTAQIVIESKQQKGAKQRVYKILKKIERRPLVKKVQRPPLFSSNGRVALATASFSSKDRLPERQAVKDLVAYSKSLSYGAEVNWGGRVITRAYSGPVIWSEVLGVAFAIIILLLALRWPFAALSPLISTLISLGSVLVLVSISSGWIAIAEFAPQLAAMVGLGVGIDYGLFVVARYKAERESGKNTNQAIATSVSTAGRTIVFAGLTVIAALSGMCLIGIDFLYGLAVAMALAVGAAMLSSLTFLPALLHLIGDKIDRFSLPQRRRRERDLWPRWTKVVANHPALLATCSTILLLLCASPVLSLSLGAADAGNDPKGQTSRLAYDSVARSFGPGSNGPLLVAGERGKEQSADILQKTRGIVSFSSPRLSEDGEAWQIMAIPSTSPQSEKTRQTVERLRSSLPQGVVVGGQTASAIDFEKLIASKLALFFCVVIGISVILLMSVFRSLLLALKAAALNLLSIAASLGATVVVFQWGLLGVEGAPIEPFLPVMLFAIVFGLSMDYEVFLLSRIQEEWKETGDAAQATNRGLLATGRVITAAAAIMIAVFLAFVLSPERVVKEFGFALAFAIFLDALVIRCALVPAIMHLLGKWAWWLPEKLERVLPEWKLEAPPEER